MITGTQIAAARALLGMAPAELARLAQLPLPTVERMELSRMQYPDDIGEAATLKGVLEHAGVTFIDGRVTSAAGGPGVRLSVPISTSVDSGTRETVQYPEMAENGPFGAGG
jgi:hypothetical protein